jgi:BolA family transcriptional regulator, general stress-responsive regulator
MNVEESIREKLTAELRPVDLVVENVSHQHAGHASSPGTGASHFNVRVVSELFRGMPKVGRFRAVHKILKAEMDGPVHALSLDLKTPDELT